MTSRFLALLRTELAPQERPIIIAPMVNQSELAFRIQCRRRSKANLCFTPMLHAKCFSEGERVRKDSFNTCAEDRPLIAQFCGNDPDTLLRAAKFVEDRVDGIDLNLGCPQQIAKKGKYGSFLLENTELLCQIVRKLSQNLSVPVSCKIRMVPGPVENTLDLCRKLEQAGCEMITLHGRYREQNKQLVGECNWDVIRQVKQAVRIPVVANGGIGSRADMLRCLEETGVDGVMSCEAVLENPTLFHPNAVDEGEPFQVALEYLELANEFPDGCQPKPARTHLFNFLSTALKAHHEFYSKLGNARSLAEMRNVVLELQSLHTATGPEPAACPTKDCAKFGPWYMRHRLNGSAEAILKNSNSNKRERIHDEEETA